MEGSGKLGLADPQIRFFTLKKHFLVNLINPVLHPAHGFVS